MRRQGNAAIIATLRLQTEDDENRFSLPEDDAADEFAPTAPGARHEWAAMTSRDIPVQS